MQKLMQALNSCALFKNLDEAFVQAVLERAEVVHKRAGETLLYEGEEARRLGVVAAGEAVVHKHTGGVPVQMSVLTVGDALGAATLFCNRAHAATEVRAKKACIILFLGEQQVRCMLQQNFEFCERYIAYLTERIHFLTGRIGSIGAGSVEGKLYAYLVNSAVGGQVLLPNGMNGLADSLGISRASLYRVMDSMAAQGRLRREGKVIHVL